MCFSAEASFGITAILLPAGAYCVRSALQKNRALLTLAIIPVVFAIQQFCEGLVWIGIDQNNPALIRAPAFVFLYFCAFILALLDRVFSLLSRQITFARSGSWRCLVCWV